MGGKDAIVVDETADLDAAADGIVAAAFGFQGQKCSACSRAIVARRRSTTTFLRAGRPKAQALAVGDPRPIRELHGPGDRTKAFEKILEYIELGKQEGRLRRRRRAARTAAATSSPPTVFADVAPRRRASRRRRSSARCWPSSRRSDFDEALEIANDTEYGLTGAVYSRDRAHLETRARATSTSATST